MTGDESTSPAFSLDEARAVLAATPVTLTALLGPVPPRMLDVNEGPGTWSPIQILRHVTWCEADDWVVRIRIIREHGPNRTFDPFDREEGFRRYANWTVEKLLAQFSALRAQSLAEIEGLALTSQDLVAEGRHPKFGRVTLEQLLATWVTHDLAHLAQIGRVLATDTGRHVGPWREFFNLLRARPE